jgi:Divergent InlB B-repeat domain
MRNRQLLPLAVGVFVALGLLASLPASSSASCTRPYCPLHRLKVNKGGNGNGTVVSSPGGIACGVTCEADYEEGTTVTLTATAAPGSTFTKWAGAGCSGAGSCVVTIDHNTTVTAVFHTNAPPKPHVSIHVKPKKNGSARCIINIPEPGKIKIWGRAVRVIGFKASHKGKFKVTLRPKGKVKQHLDNRGWTRKKRIFVLYKSNSGGKTRVKRAVRFRDKHHSK